MTSAAWTVYDAPIGPLLVAATEEGLVLVVFRAGEETAARAVAAVGRRLGCAPVEDAARLAPVTAQLDGYFAGTLKDFDLPLDWSLITGFQRRVLRELAEGCRTARWSAIRTWPTGSASRTRPARWAVRWAPIRCPWWCRATGWSRAAAA